MRTLTLSFNCPSFKCFSTYFHTHSPTCAFVHSDSLWSQSAILLPPLYCVPMQINTHRRKYTLSCKVTDFVAGSSLPHIALCLVPGDWHIEKPFTPLFNYSSYSDLSSALSLSSSIFLILYFLMPFTTPALMCLLISLCGQSVTVITSLWFNPVKKQQDNEISSGMETNGTEA